MNKYEYTRSIGFVLKGDINQFEADVDADVESILKDFVERYSDLILSFEKSVYSDTQEKKLNQKLEIKYKWLRQYAREYFEQLQREYKNNNKELPKTYSIKEAEFLGDIYQNWIDNNKELLLEFEDVLDRGKHEQSSRSDMAFYTKQFLSHDYLTFVVEFEQYSNDKNDSSDLQKLKQNIEKIQKIAEKLNNALAPDQSSGLEVARGSFNYYTINKVSKNFDKDIEEQKEKLENKYLLDSKDKNLLQKVGFENFIKNENKEITKLSLKDLYNALKKFKSQQKSKFMEKLGTRGWRNINQKEIEIKKSNTSQVLNTDIDKLKGKKFTGFESLAEYIGIERKVKINNLYINKQKNAELFNEWVEDNFPLFAFKNGEMALGFLEITDEIKELGVAKNQAKQIKNYKEQNKLDKQIRDLKIKRGKFFRGKYAMPNYFNYLKIYKSVAMNRGKIKAEIRSLEQERVEAQLLKYWVHIIEQDGHKSILLIPKNGNNLSNAKKFINSLNNDSEDVVLYDFNSLTLRALKKLIRKNLGKEVERLSKGDAEAIKLYQEVLSGKYEKIKLDFAGFEDKIQEIINKSDFKDEEDFRMALEKIAYSIKKRNLTQTDLEQLKERFDAQIFEITSYDLTRHISKPKEHTLLWQEFWDDDNGNNNYKVRINPEVRLFYRKAQENLPKKKQKNRFSKEQLIIAFTLTQNSAQKRVETAFEEDNKIVGIVKQFNEDVIKPFVEEKGEDLYYYGIDRGNQELASLCVTQFSKEKYEAMLKDGTKKELPKPVFPNIEIYTIKDLQAKKEIQIDKKGTMQEVFIIDNPSYFMDSDEEITKYFEKKTTAFIDLTTAKLIKGKIIENGDIKTYLALKEKNAKRKLFDIFSQIEPNSNIEYCDNEDHPAWSTESKGRFFMRNAFVIKLKESERNDYQLLCYYKKDLFQYRQLNEMREILQEYLNDLRGDSKMKKITIENINNLRDAITANMVGIIAFLFEKYPGIINLENLHSQREIDKHFRSNNENIARRLEWALYKKFQKIGLVPPRLQRTILLKESKNVNQFGVIHFVPKDRTSTDCPYCSEKANKERVNYEDLKFTEHALKCEKCGFDTRESKEPLKNITNSDDVASYNISKSKPQKTKRGSKRR